MKVSQEKKDKISEQILSHLFSQSPKSIFTSHIASELARDEEFIKKILSDLKKKGLVVEIKKSPKGKEYLRRIRWKLSNKVYAYYKQTQPKTYIPKH